MLPDIDFHKADHKGFEFRAFALAVTNVYDQTAGQEAKCNQSTRNPQLNGHLLGGLGFRVWGLGFGAEG